MLISGFWEVSRLGWVCRRLLSLSSAWEEHKLSAFQECLNVSRPSQTGSVAIPARPARKQKLRKVI